METKQEILKRNVESITNCKVDYNITEQGILSAMDEYAALKENKWIEVKNELPKKLGYYLVVVDEYVASSRHGAIEIQELYESVSDQKVIFKFQDYVTHWQPLPCKPMLTTKR